jgi:HAD superfamily hydrolase (TIGR01509 family)
MAIKGLIVDLFGTLAKENEALVVDICRAVMDSSPAVFNTGEVARYWWEITKECYHSYSGKDFIPLKDLELTALSETISHFDSKLPVKEALLPVFRERLSPDLYEDSRLFMGRSPLPAVVITNGDRADVEQAIHNTQLPVTELITSEDVHSYKPRPEIFKAALDKLQLPAQDVLMIGDSLQYDLAPARELGMRTAWVNRSRRALGDEPSPDIVVANLYQLRTLMLKGS